MQRLIRSFNTLTEDLREKLQEQYPDGIDNNHIRTIATAKGDSLRVIELRTSEAIYLIKINAESREEIEQFLDQEEAEPASGMDDGEGIEAPEGAENEKEEEEDSYVSNDEEDPDDEGDDEDEDGEQEEVKEKEEDEDR